MSSRKRKVQLPSNLFFFLFKLEHSSCCSLPPGYISLLHTCSVNNLWIKRVLVAFSGTKYTVFHSIQIFTILTDKNSAGISPKELHNAQKRITSSILQALFLESYYKLWMHRTCVSGQDNCYPIIWTCVITYMSAFFKHRRQGRPAGCTWHRRGRWALPIFISSLRPVYGRTSQPRRLQLPHNRLHEVSVAG